MILGTSFDVTDDQSIINDETYCRGKRGDLSSEINTVSFLTVSEVPKTRQSFSNCYMLNQQEMCCSSYNLISTKVVITLSP